MTKTPEMEGFLNDLAMATFGRKREEGQCVSCGTKVEKILGEGPSRFKNQISLKEFEISKFCQGCQDKTFR